MLVNVVSKVPTFLGVSALFGLAAASPAAEAQGQYGYHPMMGAGWFLGPLMMILFVALIVVVAILAVRWFDRDRDHGQRGERGGGRTDPLDILKERLARGEIDVAEYEERKRALGG